MRCEAARVRHTLCWVRGKNVALQKGNGLVRGQGRQHLLGQRSPQRRGEDGGGPWRRWGREQGTRAVRGPATGRIMPLAMRMAMPLRASEQVMRRRSVRMLTEIILYLGTSAIILSYVDCDE